MNARFIHLSLLFICLFSVRSFAQSTLLGKVYNGSNNTPVLGAQVQIPDLKMSVASDSDGNYSFKNVPAGTYLVEVDALGYAAMSKTVKTGGTTPTDFALTVALYEEQEVVVTGTARATHIDHTPQAVVEVSHDYLTQNSSTNIIDAISKVPGVSGITDGQSISKPVIRGLGTNRVVTINDGVRQEGQQWGDEFGIEVDPFSVNRVEILKGPASLVYGSDAISGVINFLPMSILPEGQIKGEILNGYQTNNGLISNAGYIAGNCHGIAFSSRIDNYMAHAYQNSRDGYVFNTQFSNFNTDHTIGIHRHWGFSQLHYSYFELRTGIAEGAKDSTGAFLKQAVNENNEPIDLQATNQELHSYTPFVINQLVKHNKLVWDNSINIGGGRITGTFGWQNNSRQENNDITMPNISNIWYKLNTYTYDVRYISPDYDGFNFAAGANGMLQNSTNKGTLLLIPEYDIFDIGAFAIANKNFGPLDLSAGVRYDSRTFHAHDNYVDEDGNQLPASDPNAIHQFTAFTSNFTGVSASLGGALHLTRNFYVKANAARGFRAPNVAEAASNGIKDGTVVYEVGQSTLKPEQSMEFDLTPGFKSQGLTAEISLFYNNISNFIYSQQLADSFNSSNPAFPNAPVFLYSQNDATLFGGEAMIDVHPPHVHWFDWNTSFSMVNAKLNNLPDSVNIIPFVPPARLRSELTISCHKVTNALRNGYIRFGVYHSFEQSRPYQIASQYYDIPLSAPTPAYTLLNLGIGTDVMAHGKKTCSIYLNIDNLLDNAYIDYMSRYKYYLNTVNGTTQNYVYNMGRNISVKVIVPLDFSTNR